MDEGAEKAPATMFVILMVAIFVVVYLGVVIEDFFYRLFQKHPARAA